MSHPVDRLIDDPFAFIVGLPWLLWNDVVRKRCKTICLFSDLMDMLLFHQFYISRRIAVGVSSRR